MRRHPFIENGQVNNKEGYIGRHGEMSRIMGIFENNDRDGGVAVYGLTRMGKTSLVKICFREAEKQGLLDKNHIITAELTISTVKDFSGFLKELSDKIKDALEERDLLDEKLTKLFEKMDAVKDLENDRIYEQDRQFSRILKRMAKNGIKCVVLLDEFDDALRAFKYPGEEDSANFQRFRNYASETDYNITFVLTSRVSIVRIDASPEAGSNLDGVFSKIVLTGFRDEEREEFFDKIEQYGVHLNREQRRLFISYAGRSPYLFTKLACGVLETDESILAREISVEKIFREKKRDFDDYFDSLVRHMEREEVYTKMIQLFCGPKLDIMPKDIETLKSYGYVYEDDDKAFLDESYQDDAKDGGQEILAYQTLSQYFVAYLRELTQQGDETIAVWKDLIDAEKKLRKIIEAGLREQLGDDWKQDLQELANNKKRGHLYNVEQAQRFIQSARRYFGDAVDDNPLVVIGIRDLARIIDVFWREQFYRRFNPPYAQKSTLQSELSMLHRARNPLAHGTPEYLKPEEREEVTRYCRKILKVQGERKRK